jgi:hypothetical protein
LLGLQQQCILGNDLDLSFCFHLVALSSLIKANFSALPQELWVNKWFKCFAQHLPLGDQANIDPQILLEGPSFNRFAA